MASRSTPKRRATYAIYVPYMPPMVSADARVHGRVRSSTNAIPHRGPSRHDFAAVLFRSPKSVSSESILAAGGKNLGMRHGAGGETNRHALRRNHSRMRANPQCVSFDSFDSGMSQGDGMIARSCPAGWRSFRGTKGDDGPMAQARDCAAVAGAIRHALPRLERAWKQTKTIGTSPLHQQFTIW